VFINVEGLDCYTKRFDDLPSGENNDEPPTVFEVVECS
jgi:hypothetical protein